MTPHRFADVTIERGGFSRSELASVLSATVTPELATTSSTMSFELRGRVRFTRGFANRYTGRHHRRRSYINRGEASGFNSIEQSGSIALNLNESIPPKLDDPCVELPKIPVLQTPSPEANQKPFELPISSESWAKFSAFSDST